ncbi:MAG: cryptochrome/photolyase family protein [Pseudomonadota bacterium]|nr:cryptochrome/photolyase family protein [Pseudomonadota bacterium]
MRDLILVLGDQLDPKHPLITAMDSAQDCLWMAEVDEEATHVWSHKARLVVFLSAMRHRRDALDQPLIYHELGTYPDLATALSADLDAQAPQRVRVLKPGDWRVEQAIRRCCDSAGIELCMQDDPHFMCSLDDFAAWAQGRKRFVLEDFYRWMRKRTGTLMQADEPVGGRWNYDEDNRASFGRHGPGSPPTRKRFTPDATTRTVMALVEQRWADHPGSLEAFDWPVTATQAQQALEDFIKYRLPDFGTHQDAMWTDEPFLSHSTLSVALNLKLIDPRTVIDAAVEAWASGHAPINAVEGFVRQILGWREYVRGLYWRDMPGWLEDNALDADEPLPPMYWDGQTNMRCMAQTVGQTLQYGYAHHIQRLMITGLFSLLLGVRPREIHAWYLAVYVDAVEWVELPNTLGMSQHADGGRMASKPYVASGQYVKRMSNYCRGCRYDPADATTDDACPMTTLYWDFLARHEDRFADHRRMRFQYRNYARKTAGERSAISRRANAVRRLIQDGQL